MVGTNGSIALVDFGTAKKIPPGGKTRVIAIAQGSAIYAPPEMFTTGYDEEGQAYAIRHEGCLGVYSKAGDVYSLGMMYKRDRGLADEGSPFKGLVERMIDEDPAKRPPIEEVVAALANPQNYQKFAATYRTTIRYSAEKTDQINSARHKKMMAELTRIYGAIAKSLSQTKLPKGASGMLAKVGLVPVKVGVKGAGKVIGILDRITKWTASKMGPVRATFGGMDAAVQKQMADELRGILAKHTEENLNVEEISEEILSLMKKNQTRHEKARFASPSSFNLEVLQNLPEEVRGNICGKLGINPNDLASGDKKARQILAKALSKYSPPAMDITTRPQSQPVEVKRHGWIGHRREEKVEAEQELEPAKGEGQKF